MTAPLLATLAEELAMLEPEQELASAAAEETAIQLEDAETGMQRWQEQWERFNQQSAEPRQAAEIQQARIQQLEQSLERLAERQRRLDDERAALGSDPEDAAIAELGEQLATGELRLETLSEAQQQTEDKLDEIREHLQLAGQSQQQAQGELQRLNGRIASLEALQQAAMDPGKGVSDWLRECALDTHPRLADSLRVEPGWELAVETVLGADLQAVQLEAFDDLDLAGFDQGELRLVSPASGGRRMAGSLLDKVESAVDLSPWLGLVRPVEDLTQALAARPALAEGESLISRDGYWVGRHFLRVRRAREAESGLLARGQELERLLAEREEREQDLELAEAELDRLRQAQREHEEVRERQRREHQEESRQLGEIKAQLSASTVRLEQLSLRRQRLEAELGELAEQREVETEQLGESRLRLQDALDAMAQDTEQRERLLANRDEIRESLDRVRQEARQQKDRAHQLAVRVGSIKAQHDSTRQALERLQQQFERAVERREQLSLNLEEGDAPSRSCA